MNEKELAQALLKLDMSPAQAAPDPRELTQKILARDRRRVHRLTGLAALFWVLAVAGFGLLIWQYFKSLAPRLETYVEGRREFQQDAAVWLLIGNASAGIILACIIALLLAGVCTVLLILASRRATLRQINANLVEICEQLKLLRQVSPSQPPGPVETA
jgi:hypothetical protein